MSKAKPDVIFGYFGDARQADAELTQTYRPLPKEVLAKLRIGRAAVYPLR